MTGKDDKKNLLIYAHYYVPDTASTGQILRELAEGLSDRFRVTIICVVPSYGGKIAGEYQTQKFYRETINGVDVIRIRVPEFEKSNKISRVKNILAYFFGARKATRLVGDMDYVLAISQPPILGGMLGVYGKRKKHARFIYNIQDFNPEQVMAVGYSKSRLITDAMMWFDKRTCRKSDLIITVGRDLVQTVEKRFAGQTVPKTIMINNWIDEKAVYPMDESDETVVRFKQQYGLDGRFVIMYSGNIGLYYDLENLMRVIAKFEKARTPDGREVAFAFVGDGAVLDRLKAYTEQQRLNCVKFIPYQEKENLIYSLNAGDVHWCVNAKGIKGVSCPSKYYGIAAVGKSVLAVLEPGSEIRCIIEETESGLCADPGNYKKIEENIQWFIDHADSDLIRDMGRRGRDNLLKNLTRNVSVKKYADEILKL